MEGGCGLPLGHDWLRCLDLAHERRTPQKGTLVVSLFPF
jgi:hypothetical protein